MESLYLHVPFCLKKCRYCDFTSFPDPAAADLAGYAGLLVRELELAAASLPVGPLATVYLGGGTPSLLPANQLAAILAGAARCCGLDPDCEITLEANPGTVDAAKLEALRAAGFNRLSLGAQVFDDRLLKAMGRVHGVAAIYAAVAAAHAAGFANLSLDLIFGLPGQSLAGWERTLDVAITLEPQHVSAYGLEVHPGTPWGAAAANGALTLPDEDLSLAMYQLARSKLSSAGLAQYEIANFSRPGYACRHNLTYWRNGYYLGAGVAAASHWPSFRAENHADLPAYQEAVAAGRRPHQSLTGLTRRDQMAETIFMGLRLTEGVDRPAFRARFGVDALEEYAEAIKQLKEQGLLAYDDGRMFLTGRGLPLANVAFRAFL